MKHLKKILSVTLAAAMLAAAVPAIASAAGDTVKKDHILYYDSATSKLYTKMDYGTQRSFPNR